MTKPYWAAGLWIHSRGNSGLARGFIHPPVGDRKCNQSGSKDLECSGCESQFREARVAMEVLSRNISQAALNT